MTDDRLQGLQTRAVELLEQTDDSTEQRQIVARIAPYGEPATLFPGLTETYARGAFGDPEPIPLKLERGANHAGPVVGRSIGFDDRDDGLYATFQVAETRDGDDALELAAMGALGLSAGFLIAEDGVRSIGPGEVEITRADLRETTLTGTPAYRGAVPVEVRSTDTQEVSTMDHADKTEQTTQELSELVTDAVRTAVDEVRSEMVQTAADELPAVDATSRGHAYRSIGDVLADMNQHARGLSAGATERLTRSIDAGIVSTDGSTLTLETRDGAFDPPVPNSVGAGVAFDQYIPDLLELLREGRPVADLFNSRDLPDDGNKVFLPAVSVGNTVGFQDAQGSVVERTDQLQILTDFPKGTIAGGQPMSIQAQMWTNPSYFESVVMDLGAAYSEFVDWATINGDPAVETPASGTGYLGILNAGATDVPVGGDHTAAIALFGTAWAAVFAGSRRAPIAAAMNSVDWGGFLDAVDTDGRPIVTTDAPSNPAGLGNAASIGGTIRGLPAVIDDNVPAGNVILGSYRDALLFEDSGSPAQIALTFPSNLQTDVTLYGFSALAIRRPAAFAILSGIA